MDEWSVEPETEMDEREIVLRGLYLLQARLLEALAFNRHPPLEVTELADSLVSWRDTHRQALAEAQNP